MDDETPFRKQYGVLDAWKDLSQTKSGLTPTEYIFPSFQGSDTAQQTERIEEIQRNALYGWTTRELADLDALCIRDTKLGDLDTPIIPIIDLPAWEEWPARASFTRAHMYQLQNGQGVLSAHNPVVWKILKPALRIATWYLTNNSVLGWFDALFNGPRERIPDDRLPSGYKGRKFFSFRPPAQPTPMEELIKQRDTIFEDLRSEKVLKIGFMSGSGSPEGHDGPQQEMTYVCGYTCINFKQMFGKPQKKSFDPSEFRIFIWINGKYVERLLVKDLGDSERCTLQWKIALTLVHEMMHALEWRRAIDEDGWRTAKDFNLTYEPYFMDSTFSELGFSFEQLIHGGLEEEIGVTEKTTASGATVGEFLRPTYPSMKLVHLCGTNTPVLTQPRHFKNYDLRFPMPMSLMEDLQTKDFWSVGVRCYGLEIIFYRFCKVGTRVNYNFSKGYISDVNPGRKKEGKMTKAVEYERKIKLTVEKLHELTQLSPEERSMMEFGYNFLQSSSREENFWSLSSQMSDVTQGILKTLDGTDKDNPSVETLKNIYTSFVMYAILNHQHMIAYTLLMEEEKGISYTARRESLLKWNRGTQIFVRQTGGKFILLSREDLAFQTQRYLVMLERCRLRLSNPLPSPGTTNPEELQLLRLRKCREALSNPLHPPSKSDLDEIEKLALSILASDGGTRILFEHCCATILIAFLGRENASEWQLRVDLGERFMQSLSYMTAKAAVSTDKFDIAPEWKTELNAWVAMMKYVIATGPPAG